MIFLKNLAKYVLNLLIIPLKIWPSILEYLAEKPLKNELKAAVNKSNQYEHIYHSINIAKNLSNQNGLIIDVGAAIGNTSAIFRESFPNNKILAFEPLSTNFEKITKRNIGNLEVRKKGLGNSPTMQAINITNRITASSFLEINPSAEVYQEETKSTKQETVEISTLDIEVINTEVLILKLDVQGFELEVLNGGKSCLRLTRIIILEVNNNNTYINSPSYFEIDEFMRSNNFQLFDIIPNYYENNKLMDWDCIYLNTLN